MKSWRRPLLGALLFSLLIAGLTAPKVKALDSPDFKVFYTAGRHAVHSPELLYTVSPDRYLYPPEASLFFIPFSLTDRWELHRWSWHFFLASVLFLLASGSWAALGSAALLSRYLAINFGYGQVNLVVLALMIFVSALLARKKIAAGIVWAIACLTKIFPAVQLVEFLLRRRFSELALAATAVIGLVLITVGFWGWDTALSLHQQFFSAIGSKGLPLHSHNQSFSALFLRLCTHEVFELHTVAYVSWGVVSLPAWLAKALAFMLGGALSYFSWRKAALRALPWDFCAAALFSVLFLSHLVWKDYFVFLFVPLCQILEVRQRGWIPLVVVFVMLVTLSSRDVVGPYNAAFLDAACIHLWAAILVWWGWVALKVAPKEQEKIPA